MTAPPSPAGSSARGDAPTLSALAVAGFYFCHFACIGVLVPYLPAFLTRRFGVGADSLGALLAIGPLMTVLAPPLWGLWADRQSARRGTGGTSGARALLWRASALSVVGLAGLAVVPTAAAVPVALFVLYASLSAVVPLADSVALGVSAPYQRLRWPGSVGFALVAMGYGAWLRPRPEAVASLVTPLLAMGLCASAALVAWRLIARSAGTAVAGGAPAHAPTALGRAPTLRDVGRLYREAPFRRFLVCAVLHWLAQAPYHGFMALTLRERGLGEGAAGNAFAAGVAAEVAVMAAFGALVRRVPLVGLFGVCFAASAVRWWVTAQATSEAVLVSIQTVHGLTFGLFYVGAVMTVQALSPKELVASGQAVFAATTYGLGGAVGYLVAGRAFAAGGSPWAFRVAAVLELLSLLALVPVLRRRDLDGIGRADSALPAGGR